MELTSSAKRSTYLIGFSIGLPLLLLVLVAWLLTGSATPFNLVSLLLFAAVLSVLLAFVVADRGIDHIKYYLVGAQALYFYTQAGHAAWRAPDLDVGAALAPLAPWICVMYLLSFWLFGSLHGRQFCLSFSTLNLITVMLLLAPRLSAGEGWPDALLFLQVFGVTYVVVAGLTRLVQTVERHTEAATRLNLLAMRDVLTGLANRLHMQSVLEDEFRLVRRYKQPFALALLDIDHFKNINDAYGHAAGDGVLRQVGLSFTREARQSDVIARWGGEEFLLLLRNAEEADAVASCERLRLAIERTPFPIPRSVTVSVGIARYREGDTQAELLERADRALYQAKAGGRNRVVLFGDADMVVPSGRQEPLVVFAKN